jgi:hypothetical protein
MLRLPLLLFCILLSALASAQNWARYFDYNDHSDSLAGMVTDSRGTVFVTGSSYDGQSTANQTFAYDSVGNIIWQDRWNSAVGEHDVPSKLMLVNGYLYILGQRSTQTNTYTYVLRYAASGGVPSVGYFDADPFNETPHGMAVDGSGDIYVCGEHGNYPWSSYIVKFDHMTMAPVWNKSYNFSYADRAVDIVCDSLGRTYTLVQSNSQASVYRVEILKHDKDGTVVWKYFYGLPNVIYKPTVLRLDAASNCFWCGSQSTPSGYYDALVQKVDVHGITKWTASYDGADHMHDNLTKLVLDAAGNAFAAGSSQAPNDTSYVLTLKVNPSGGIAAARTALLSPGDYESARDISLDSSNRLYVVANGISGPTANGPDFFELGYDTANMSLFRHGSFGGGMGIYDPVSISSVGNGHVVMAGVSNVSSHDFVTFQAVEKPAARPDAYLVNYGHPLTVGAAGGVFKNDVYNVGAYVFYTDNLTKLTASFNVDGSFTVTPKAGQFGTDNGASYYLIRESLKSDSAVISFNIVPTLASLAMNPATIGINGTSTGTVTLNHVAGTGGTTVTLSSSNGNIFLVPTSVTVLAGHNTVTFQGHSNTIKGTVTVTARWNGVVKTATVTVQ